MRELIIPKTAQPVTLLSFLKKQFPKGYVQKLLRKDGVRVNGVRGKKETMLRAGDKLTFYVPFETNPKKTDAPAPKKNLAFDIIYEDQDFLVLNKKAGMAVHEGKSISFRTSLIGRLADYYKPQNVTPWLVHRLDRDTSGCLLIVKKESLVPGFEKMFETGQVEKEYLTLIKGVFKERSGKITLPLTGRDGTLVSAVTYWEVKKVFAGAKVSLLKVIIQTGRMHQIRLHFAKVNHPVVMDDEHGHFAFNKIFRKKYKLKRQFLHAAQLGFTYQGKPQRFAAPLPEDLEKTLEQLE